jgi:putative heme-binding domain-containing protein
MHRILPAFIARPRPITPSPRVVAALQAGVWAWLWIALVGVAWGASPTQPPATGAFELRNGDRVLFLGDTLIEREGTMGHLETALTLAFADRDVTFRNLGWSADVPTGRSRASFDWSRGEENWFTNLVGQVAAVKPTVVFLGYGMSASFDGPAGLDKFVRDTDRLLDRIVADAAPAAPRFVILGPVRHEDLGAPLPDPAAHNTSLALYNEALRQIATRRAAPFVDLFKELPHGTRPPLTDNGIHLTDGGYRRMAQTTVRLLGLREQPAHEALREVILKKNELFFNRWRPENSTYLFLFRKHEQGQNAREIPQFDPLIAEQERQIATLRRQPPASKAPAAAAGATPRIDPTPQSHPTFELAPGLEINLYAENPKLYKPIHMNFDAQGRLWVASSSVYPQIKPGQTADDSVIVLEDTNHDGVAETSRVFADGLLIPTGVEPGDGGVYVGQSTELLHFKDTNGDGRADVRRTVLSGFGTEDTHHILHTLHWGMDGQLYMNQSIYIHTHTETPNGVVHLNSGGILNLRPSTLELGIHLKGLVNTWGHQMDIWGQSFATDGAGIEGINYVVPQAMYFTYAGARRILGSVSPGTYPKFCSLEILYSPVFPEDWQGSMVTCDFRAHRVVRFAISEQGSAYVTQEMPDLVRSQDATFRPIDVKLGPDGALYIADWSNPIIQHGEVDFRDPRRDKEHGRIWRVTRKGGPVVPVKDLTKASTSDLLGLLTGPSGFHREKARRVLTERGKSVLPTVRKWVAAQKDERAQLEGLWLHQAVDEVNEPLLARLLSAKDGRVRAAAVRVLAFWGHRVSPEVRKGETRVARFAREADVPAAQQEHVLELLAPRVADDHPRVRLEALRALARFPTARAAELALSALDHTMDNHLDYALWLTINDLSAPWLAALKSGSWKIEGREKQLEYGLRAIEPAQAGQVLEQILAQHPLDRDGSGKWIELIGQAGGPPELRRLFDQAASGGFSEGAVARALAALDNAARVRKVTPAGGRLERVGDFFRSASEPVQVAAVRLAGAWRNLGGKAADLKSMATGTATSPALRSAVLETLKDIGGSQAVEILTALSGDAVPPAIRHQAVIALAGVKLDAAVGPAVQALLRAGSDAEAYGLWRSLVAIRGAAPLLTHALPKSGIPPMVAKAGLRAARESGRSEPDLVLALTRGADLAEGEASLSDSELKAMAAQVLKAGDPNRGEEVYRRLQLGCQTCHSIGGAGGKVGPDMTSIGASAPVDYLIESVWFPNRKVKEGFNSTLIETKDGLELSGILLREEADRVVLRDTAGGEVAVAKNNIEKRTTGGSLMPAGLIDGITPAERLDLFRFLSELGKPGSFDASKGNVARGWKLRPGNHQDEQFGVDKMVARPLSEAGWGTAWSYVDGRLPRYDLQQAGNVQRYIGLIGIYAATRLQVPKAGPVRLRLEGCENASVWIDDKPVPAGREPGVDLSSGTHTVVVRLDPKNLPEFLRVASPDGTFVMP